MYQFYNHALLNVFDELRSIEFVLSSSSMVQSFETAGPGEFSSAILLRLALMRHLCEDLKLLGSSQQIKKIQECLDSRRPATQLAPMLTELRIRVKEDLERQVFYSIEEGVAGWFFKPSKDGTYEPKVASELMQSIVVSRFPSALSDIEQTYKCFVFGCYAASMFHLMRVAEVALFELGGVIGMKDAAPSWDAVIARVDMLVFGTRREYVEQSIRPHMKMLESILPKLQAIQRAWRNKFTHAGSKLIPNSDSIDEATAVQMLGAVEPFMEQLARDLPR